VDKFIKYSDEEKRDIFNEAAIRQNTTPIIMEKDFWVCWMLKLIYSIPDLTSITTFKGGTSISKAYGLIDRFSEDIDLTLDKSKLGAELKSPLEEAISKKEKARRIEAVKVAAQQFVQKFVLPLLRSEISKYLGEQANWTIELDPLDPDKQTLLFAYPRTLNYGKVYGKGAFGVGLYGEGEFGYIKPFVRLEFGARGDIEPSMVKVIKPYIAEIFPDLLGIIGIEVPTLSIARTFLEKVTILHAICHGSKFRDRLSRHYYDTYMIAQDERIIEKALENNADLLKDVVLNKSTYFQDSKASYDTAKIGTLKLVPSNEEQMKELEKDYKSMNEMFMKEAPDFNTIMLGLKSLEQKLNKYRDA
jgi:predicted nucleotidyltransferase component of viral defense system